MRSDVRERLGFSVGGFGQNLIYNWVTLFFLVYVVDGIGMSSRSVGILSVILTLARVWDAINDLMVGMIVDRTRTRWGRFRPYIVATAPLIAVLTIAMFALPAGSETRQLVLIAVIYLAWDVVYSLSDVPYWALTTAVPVDGEGRTKMIAGGRTAALVATAVVTLGGAPLAIALSGGADDATATGWTWATILVSIVGCGLFTVAAISTRERVTVTTDQVTLATALRHLASNRPLLLLLASGTLGFGRMILPIGGAVIAVVVFGSVDVFTTLGGAILVGVAVGTLTAPVLLRRMTRLALAVGSTVAGVVFYLVMWVLGSSSQIVVAAVFAAIGITVGAYGVAQTGMIGDVADLAEIETGVRSDGVCFAGLTFMTKLAAALATLIFGITVAAVGYEEGVVVTDAMKRGIWLAATVVPALTGLASLVPLRWYRVPEADLAPRVAERDRVA